MGPAAHAPARAACHSNAIVIRLGAVVNRFGAVIHRIRAAINRCGAASTSIGTTYYGERRKSLAALAPTRAA